MPYLRNPLGKIVCVSEDEKQRLLAEMPIKFMKGGKLAESRGFREATENEIAALREIEKKAAVEAKREEHERLVHSKRFSTDILEGFKALAKDGRESSAKDDQ